MQAAIGWQYVAEAPVRVSLMWMHPASSSSVEFLFGARGDQKRYKRKRGERHPDVHSQFAPIGASSIAWRLCKHQVLLHVCAEETPKTAGSAGKATMICLVMQPSAWRAQAAWRRRAFSSWLATCRRPRSFSTRRT
jgi:hypothetical protein